MDLCRILLIIGLLILLIIFTYLDASIYKDISLRNIISKTLYINASRKVTMKNKK